MSVSSHAIITPSTVTPSTATPSSVISPSVSPSVEITKLQADLQTLTQEVEVIQQDISQIRMQEQALTADQIKNPGMCIFYSWLL